MEEGQSIRFIRGTGSPLKAPTLGHVAAAMTVGIPFSSGQPLLDTVEEKGEGEPLHREHIWTFEGQTQAHFRPSFKEEAVDLKELVRRLESREWCLANPDHPIAYMHFLLHNRAQLVERLKGMKPLEKITRGEVGNRSICLIPSDAMPEDREKMLAEFNKAA